MHVLLASQVNNVATQSLPPDILAPFTHGSAMSMGLWTTHSDIGRHNRPRTPEQGRAMVHHQELQHSRQQDRKSLLHAGQSLLRCEHYHAVSSPPTTNAITHLMHIYSTIYACFLILTIYSLIPTTAAQQAHATKRAEKRAEKEKWANSPTDNEMTAEEQWQHMWELQQLPRTPGLKGPMTPRTRTFNELEGGNGFGGQVQPGGYYSNMQLQHGGYYDGAGGVTVQQISPVEKMDEPTFSQYEQHNMGKGKGQVGAGAAY